MALFFQMKDHINMLDCEKKKKIVFHSPLKYSKNIVIIRFLPVRVVVKTWNSSFLVSICFLTIILIFYAYEKLINHVAKQNIR